MTLRYGIIGSGLMGQEHIRNLGLIEGTEVTAIADPDEGMRDKARALAGEHCRAFRHHAELLDSGLADVLLIASPNHTHIEVLLDVLPADLPILVEKPLCTTVEDCRRVLAAAEGRKAPVWVTMEYRYMPPLARLREIVQDGGIGRLRMLAIREHRHPFLPKVGDWNRFARNTGGTLVEKCCHFFDLMRLIVESEPVRVMASGGQDVNHLDEVYPEGRPDILDNAYVIVDFESGARAMLDLCMFAEVSRDQEEIAAIGDRGKVECGVPSSMLLHGDRASGRLLRTHVPVDERALAAGAHHGSTYYQHLAFIEMLRTGGAPEVSLADGLAAVAMGQAAELSVKEGRVVRMEELGLPRREQGR